MNLFPTEKVYSELNKVISNLRSIGIEIVILKSEREYTSYKNISDVDIYTSVENKEVLNSQLRIMGFKKIISFRNIKIREFYSKIIGGALIKLDVSFELCCYGKNIVHIPSVDINWIRGLDNNNYLTEESASLFVLKNSVIKNRLKPCKVKFIKEDILKQIKNKDEINLIKADNMLENYFNNGVNSKISIFHYIKRQFKKISRKKIKICFIGADGAGKGTYISLLQSSLKELGFQTENVYLGHSQYKMSLMYKLSSLKLTEKNKWIIKYVRLAYLILFPLEIMYRKKWSEADICIYDRHTFFEPVFNGKYLGVYNLILNFCSTKPDIFIYLHGDKKILWERKKEMDYSCFSKKCNELSKLVDKNKEVMNIISVNTTNGDINNIYGEVWNIIHDFIKKDI